MDNNLKTTIETSDLLDIEAASKLLGYKTGSMYQLISKRLIPHYKIPGIRRVYFSRTELEEWIKNPAHRVTTIQELSILALNRSLN
ncbi:helix-turn-helix domain-containing protein [Algoriphagus sp. AK58]|uniref:helix-turn-helix domain-containing protein n=1 Tax=Algoriphagus sp. AK58 TaxID=1406877 RepID=UPI0016505167|nr:DNA-binding protein [Algoriphagus sp. AK58]